jgi:acyl carrier protein
MAGATVLETVIEVISEQKGIDYNSIQANDLLSSLGIDDIDIDEIIGELEEIYDIEFSLLYDDIQSIKRVSGFVKMVKSNYKKW